MDQIVEWAKELQSIAQAGLFYGHDDFDKERYQRIRDISAEMVSERTGLPLGKVKELFCNEYGYQTPKVDTKVLYYLGSSNVDECLRRFGSELNR